MDSKAVQSHAHEYDEHHNHPHNVGLQQGNKSHLVGSLILDLNEPSPVSSNGHVNYYFIIYFSTFYLTSNFGFSDTRFRRAPT